MNDQTQMTSTMPTGAASALDNGLERTLKPCPFCGKSDTLEMITGQELMDDEQEFWQHSESFGVVCNAAKPDGPGGCGAMGGFSETKEAAAAKWNLRSNAAGEGLSTGLLEGGKDKA